MTNKVYIPYYDQVRQFKLNNHTFVELCFVDSFLWNKINKGCDRSSFEPKKPERAFIYYFLISRCMTGNIWKRFES